MNIIIPLGGKGERFLKNGYNEPKPLIKILDKCMIEYVIDNLNISNDDKLFIIYNSKLDNYIFNSFIEHKYPFINLIKINDTKGATETLLIGIDIILNNFEIDKKKCLILDCDTFYTEDIKNIFLESTENIVFYTKNTDVNAIYSYIELNDDSIITNIREKQKISDNANTGAYAFTDINILYEYCNYVINNNITFNNEPYTSCVISEMIKSNIVFKGYELKNEFVFSLGTPLAVDNYIENTHAFMFDLDGTIVISDNIYYDIWYSILIKYNIVLTEEIFNTYIQGKNDIYVLNTLLKNINISLTELSEIKNSLFLNNIHKIKVVDGIYNFLTQIKLFGHKACIVTNSNKNVATEIVKYINIDKNIDFIISNNDCQNGKPHTEPYINAINRYNINNSKCIVFEDSKTGILSGKGVYPKLLIGIKTIYCESELNNLGVDFCINDFKEINILNLFSGKVPKNNINFYKNLFKMNMIYNIKDIHIDNNKLKGGFIADVISFKITTNDNKTFSKIFKYENVEESNLSLMAKKLHLYEREYYFYTTISRYINVKIPIFYNLIISNDKTLGIVLENLFSKNYKNNLNLNQESIDVTLKIVDRMAKMHSSFWNKNLKTIFPNLKACDEPIFHPFFKDFINERYDFFKTKWFKILNHSQIDTCNEIYKNFDKIQQNFSIGNNLTFIHGDIKSPNIFYDTENNFEPYFIDWQHCAIGKGVQDLIFFIIESFDITNMKHIFYLTKEYYYKKIIEYGVVNYSIEEYENDIYDAICYIPFFTSIWFGTTPEDELIDKNFPYFLITKLFYLIEIYKSYRSIAMNV